MVAMLRESIRWIFSGDSVEGHLSIIMPTPIVALEEIAGFLEGSGITVHDGRDFSAMLALYERMGLLRPDMLAKLRPPHAELADNWRKLHEGDASLACTLVARGPDGVPQGAITAVRAWDEAWLIQHFGVMPEAEPGTAVALQIASSSLLLTRADLRHACCFVGIDNARVQAWFDQFFRLGDAFEVASRIDLVRWARLPGGNSKTIAAPAGLEILAIEPGAPSWGAFTRCLGPIASDALSMQFNTTSRAFACRGLERERNVLLLFDRGHQKAFLIEERASPGVNLSGMLDTWWLFSLDESRPLDESIVELAANAISTRCPDERAGILLIPGSAPPPLRAPGFTRIAGARLYAFNRTGVRRFRDELALRYGDVRAAMERRRARDARGHQ